MCVVRVTSQAGVHGSAPTATHRRPVLLPSVLCLLFVREGWVSGGTGVGGMGIRRGDGTGDSVGGMGAGGGGRCP